MNLHTVGHADLDHYTYGILLPGLFPILVKVKVDGMPTAGPASGPSLMGSIMDEIKPHAKPSEREAEWTEDNPKPGSVAYLDQHREEAGQKDTVSIMVDIRMSNGMQIRHRNLSRHQLLKLVENLEALC